MYSVHGVSLLLLMGLVASAQAQGFRTFNERNHPELAWQAAQTAHFEIIYPAHLTGLENQVASIAETTYTALSANLGVTFSDRLRIYLTDEDEIANGFAVPIGTGFTNIWVHVNEVAATWTGREKWLRKVVAHELAHLFHFKAVRSPLGPYTVLFGNPLPRFWVEGLAQYETEVWDAYRGDRWLRTAVLDDRLGYNDGRSLWNSRLLYAVGNAQVRYFAQQYGDTTLAALLQHRKPVLLGLARVHDFDAAFEAVTDQPYRSFYDAWRRHVNVYYNTLAGQMETPDSLGTDPLDLPGQYLYDLRYSPDTTQLAVLAVASLDYPVRRLYVVDRATRKARVVAEGAIKAPIAWHPDGERLAFARRTRGNHGALVHDLFMVGADGKGKHRLTHSRRAFSPSFAADGTRLAFVAPTGETANVFVYDLQRGQEQQVTAFTGDVQLGHVAWHPTDDVLALARFDADGRRDLLHYDLNTRALTPLTDGTHDDRYPVWRPDGTQLAYTSLRDGVPNVFVYDLASGEHARITHLATGATAQAWLPPDSTHASGTLAVIVATSKTRDRAYGVDAERRVAALALQVPAAYAAWTYHRPPHEVPPHIDPHPTLIQQRAPYRPLRHLTHVFSLAAPYYGGRNDWGLFGLTAWLEPLSKHLFVFSGNLSFAEVTNSFFNATYVNNRWGPTLAFSAYHFPGAAQVYSDEVLVETLTGGEVTALWPLDLRVRPYVTTTLALRLRHAQLEPINPEAFGTLLDGLPPPETGRQTSLRMTLQRRKQRPYRYNVVHPLDGVGVRVQATGAARVLGGDHAFLRAEVAAFAVVPALGRQRVFLYGRAQAQVGTTLAQHQIGFGRYDAPRVAVPVASQPPLVLVERERVRGYRAYALGDRLLFGTLEYRIPLVPDLQTRLLGLVSFGATAAALFADAGVVWTHGQRGHAMRRLGVGVEVKNALRLMDTLTLMHALGLAQPYDAVGPRQPYDLYYRIQLAVPF